MCWLDTHEVGCFSLSRSIISSHYEPCYFTELDDHFSVEATEAPSPPVCGSLMCCQHGRKPLFLWRRFQLAAPWLDSNAEKADQPVIIKLDDKCVCSSSVLWLIYQQHTVWDGWQIQSPGIPDWRPGLLQSDQALIVGNTHICRDNIHQCTTQQPCNEKAAGHLNKLRFTGLQTKNRYVLLK